MRIKEDASGDEENNIEKIKKETLEERGAKEKKGRRVF